MKKMDFLIKLKEEGKLELVEPSEEIKQSYIDKSDSNLISSKILLENNKLEESVGLAYYSMYNSLIALLFKIGIKSENHVASIILLKELFGIDNSDIAFAKKERVDKQYYINFEITKEQVEDAVRKAELFNGKILDFISKITNEDTQVCRKKFDDLIKKRMR